MKNGLGESETLSNTKLNAYTITYTNSNDTKVMPKASADYSHLPKFIKDKINKDKQANLNLSCTNNILNNKADTNSPEDDSEKQIDDTDSNKNINNKNLYRDFFKSNVFNNHREHLIMPVLNVDNIDSYMEKITKENCVKNSEKSDIKSQKYSHSHSLNNTYYKLKSMKPKIGENLEKFKEEIQAKQKIKFEKFEPKEIMKIDERKNIDPRLKIQKTLDEKDLWKNSNTKFVLENLKEKNQEQKILYDNALIYNDFLEFKDFIETYDNKFKNSLIPRKNFSQNIFKFENDFYENLCHQIQNVSKPIEITDIYEDFSSIAESQNSESFLSHRVDKSYTYTDGSNISEINPTPDTKFFKLKNSNFKIKRYFNDSYKLKEIKLNSAIKNTLKLSRRNIKSISTTIGTLKGNINIEDIANANREMNESFINSSFLVENIPDELVTHLENLQKKNLQSFSKNSKKESNKMESVLFQNTKQRNLYKELEKKVKRGSKIFS